MRWPFRRADPRRGAEEGLAAPDPADLAVLESAAAWWRAAGPYDAVLESAQAVLRVQRTEPGARGLVIVARRGKLTRVDVEDPRLRPAVDEMVRHFEAAGVWSFNGVIRTRSDLDEAPPP